MQTIFFAELTVQENKVFELLKNVDAKCPYSFSCRQMKTVIDFRKIVKHFQDQALVSPLLVEIIIGKTALDAVVSLKEVAVVQP